jgi:hypothetical protein
MSERAVIVLVWSYTEKAGPNLDAVMRAIGPHVPDEVCAYGAIGDTARAVLACFNEDAH